MMRVVKGLLLLLFIAPFCFGTTVVNSFDGRDVVSAIYYAAVINEDVVFVTPVYNEQVIYGKIEAGQNVFLVESADNRIIIGMENDLTNRGNTVETFISEDPYETNLELAEKSGATKFILVDPVYGYNAVSVLAYAKLNSMYLIFADKNNMDSVVAFLKSRNPEDILLYGYIDGDVKNALSDSGLGYREINNGDKFDDNLEITKLYFEQNPSKQQVILSDGNGFEDTLAAGDDPAVLISVLVPTAVYDYMKEEAISGQIKVAMVVDQEYAQTAYDLKTSINKEIGSDALHVLVKFGQSVGTKMYDIEFFPLPGPKLGLNIENVEYNTLSGELEVTYGNTGNALEYVRSHILVFVDESFVGTVGDEESFAIGREEKLGIGYPVDVEEGEITVNITSYFSSSKKYTENGIQLVTSAGRVDFVDASVLEISEFTEDTGMMDLYVTFTNTGDTVVYFRPDATVDMNGTSTKIKDDNVYELSAGDGRMIKFPGIAKSGSVIIAGADYGAREAFLDSRIDTEFVPVGKAEGFELDSNLLYIIVIVLLVAVIGYLAMSRKK